MVKNLEEKKTALTQRRKPEILKMLRQVLNKKMDSGSVKAEKKGGQEVRGNIIFGGFSKETNTFY